MKVELKDGTLIRIQYVHSAHDPKNPVIGVPGGLRQVVDDLAASLRRRVTLCEISYADFALDTPPEGVEAKLAYVPLGYGFSVCHYFDQFVKSEGRARSLDRAVRASGLSKDVQAEILELVSLN